jgi:glutaminase
MMSQVSLPIKGLPGKVVLAVVLALFLKSLVATWSPKLNKNSNWVHALELLTTKLECRFFSEKVVVSATFDIYRK